MQIKQNPEAIILSRASVFIYGTPKVGKTTAASTALPGTLILSCQRGEADFLPGAHVAEISRLQELVQARIPDQYQAVNIDSLTTLLQREVRLTDGRKQDVFPMIAAKLSSALDNLAAQAPYIFATGHHRTVADDEGTVITPALSNTLAAVVMRWFDAVLYVTEEGVVIARPLTKRVKKGNKTVTRSVQAGSRVPIFPTTFKLAQFPEIIRANIPTQETEQEAQE